MERGLLSRGFCPSNRICCKTKHTSLDCLPIQWIPISFRSMRLLTKLISHTINFCFLQRHLPRMLRSGRIILCPLNIKYEAMEYFKEARICCTTSRWVLQEPPRVHVADPKALDWSFDTVTARLILKTNVIC